MPRDATPVRREGTGWATVGAAVARRPRVVWAGTALALVALALAATSLNLGLTQEQAFRTTPESVVGQRLISEYFPAGRSAPTEVVASSDTARPVADAVRALPGVASVLPVEPSTNGTLVRIPAVLTDPPDSAAAQRTVARLRAAVDAVPGADALVGGPTATTLDIEQAAASDRARVIPLALGVVLLILALLLRSLVAPLLLVATVVLSFLAALGASTLLFEHVFGFDAVDHSLPLLGFVFLVALGVDYNIFLMTRVREETRRLGHVDGVLRGLTTTGGVITSAGLVLAATFAVFVGLPVVFLAAMGVLVAVGVLLDTFVVRSVLVPALALDIGPRIWWPGTLARRSATPTPPPREPVAPR
ncbi:MAG: MMPL family transporter [Pseudonocardiaceae bacterium]